MLSAIQEMAAWVRDFRFRRRSIRWTRAQLEAQRAQRFRELIRFAVEHSPYYADLFAEHGLSPETVRLEEIPPVNKETLIEQFDRIVTVPTVTGKRVTDFLANNPDPTQLLDNKYYAIRTSGTSGMPGYTVFSVREWIRGCSLQMRQMPGLQWRRRLAFVGVINGHFAGVSMALTGRRGINRAFYDCQVFDHNLPLNALVEKLNKFQPAILSGYANIHSTLVQQALGGCLRIRPKYIVSSGEPMRPQLRDLLEKTYQAKVIDMYASSEGLLLAGGTSAEGLMLYEEDNSIELFPDHVLLTNVFNRTLPLIRYRINDVLQPRESLRPDTPFRWIRKVVGRNEQTFELCNNDGELETIYPLSILYMPIPPVPGLQVVIINSTNLIFRVLVPAQMPMSEQLALLQATQSGIRSWLAGKKMDQSVRFQVVAVGELEIDPKSGKAKPIIRSSPTVQMASAA